MLPMIIIAEKKRQHARVMLSGVMLIAAVQFSFGMFQFPLSILVIAMILYFTGFNLMEALLPSMISSIQQTFYANLQNMKTSQTLQGLKRTLRFLSQLICANP